MTRHVGGARRFSSLRRATACCAAAIAAFGQLAVARADAAAVSTTGAAQIVTAPLSVAAGRDETKRRIDVFEESAVTLSEDRALATALATGVVIPTDDPEGVCVQSHLIHYDGRGEASSPVSGSVTFSGNIVTIISSNRPFLFFKRPLDATDATFGARGTTYPKPGNDRRGGEVSDSEAVHFERSNPKTVSFRFAGDGFDEVRVLTDCDTPPPVLPEVPINMLLPLAGLAVIGAVSFRRRTRLEAS